MLILALVQTAAIATEVVSDMTRNFALVIAVFRSFLLMCIIVIAGSFPISCANPAKNVARSGDVRFRAIFARVLVICIT